MIRREIDLDEGSDRILSGLAQDYHGDLGEALADPLQTHQSVEAFVEDCGASARRAATRRACDRTHICLRGRPFLLFGRRDRDSHPGSDAPRMTHQPPMNAADYV